MKRLAIITSHPIQYNAPWFKLLAERHRVESKVFYTWGKSVLEKKYDPGFGKVVEWDIPLLEGYDHCFVNNVSPHPGTHGFKGIDNPTLISEIESWKPDAILVFGWAFKSHLKCIRHFKGKIPVIFRGDSTLLDETKGIKSILRRLFLIWLYRHIDYALYVGTNNKKYFLAHGVGEHRLVHAPHAIDNNRFAAPDEQYSQEAATWRKNLGIASTDIVLLFAGKLEPKKNPFFLLQLAERLSQTNLRFVLAGNGVLENELKSKARNDQRIIFIDFVNQQRMPALYRIADIFILPSRGPGETWGLALNEAMACGRAVVSTPKVGGAIDLVIEKENGFLVDPGKPEDLVQQLEELTKHPEKLKEMGDRSKIHIRNFSFEKIVTAIEELTGKL